MQIKRLKLAPWLMLFMLSASAQTVTGSGTSGTVPIFTGTSAVGNSAITQSGGNVGIGTSSPAALLDVEGSLLHSGLVSTTPTSAPGVASEIFSFNGVSSNVNGWDAITAAVTNPSTSSSTQYYGYSSTPSITATDGISRAITGGYFSPSLVASGGSTSNYISGVSGNAYLGSASATAGYTSLYGASFQVGIAPTVPATTAVTNVIGGRFAPLVDSGSVTVVRGIWVTSSFGAATGPANLIIPKYYGLELAAPNHANGATITESYGISQEDAAAKNYFAGRVGVGTATPGAALEINGSIKLTAGSTGAITFQDGTTQSTAFIPANCGADYAEAVDVTGDRTKYEPGDILVIDANAPGKFLKSNQPYSTLVAGIYSTQPGFVGRFKPADLETGKT